MKGISRRDIMAISRSDRANETNRLSELKDEYDSRETATLKKKNAEIKRNQTKHQEELKETRATYENKINDMQSKFLERLNDTDRSHQRQIENVRGVYASQLRKKMEESQNERERLTENYKSEKQHQNTINESQKNTTQRKFNEEINKRNEQIDDLHQSSRENMQKTLAERNEKMRAAHEKEKSVLVQANQDEQQKSYDERTKLRRYFDSEIGKHKKANQRENENWASKYSNTVQAMNSQYSDEIKVRNEMLKQEVNKARNRFEDKYAALEERLNGSNENFRDNVDEKLNNQIQTKDNQIYALKNRMHVDKLNQKKMDGIEKQHIVDDYEKKLGIYERNLNEQRDALKEVNDKRISKATQTHSDILQKTTLKNRVAQALSDEKHRQDRNAIQEQNKNDLFNVKNAAEKRVDTIQRLANESEGRITNYYDDYLGQMKEGYIEKIFEQREKHDKDLANLTNTMGEKFRKLKLSYEQRLDRTTRGFEEKIARLNEEHSKEMKSITKQNEVAMSEKNKAIVNARSEVEDKYENKIKTLQEQYRGQVDRMKERHHEDMKELSLKMQNYSRKA